MHIVRAKSNSLVNIIIQFCVKGGGGGDNIRKWAIYEIQLQWLTPYLNKSYVKLGHRNEYYLFKNHAKSRSAKSRCYFHTGHLPASIK